MHHILNRLQVVHLVDDFLAAGPTSKVVRIRRRAWDAVTEVVALVRDVGITSPNVLQQLWAARARTAAEIAQIGPITRGVRSLKAALEAELQTAGRQPQLCVEVAYRPDGPVGTFISADQWRSEYLLLDRDAAGLWRLADEAYFGLRLDVMLDAEPAEWLRTLL